MAKFVGIPRKFERKRLEEALIVGSIYFLTLRISNTTGLSASGQALNITSLSLLHGNSTITHSVDFGKQNHQGTVADVSFYRFAIKNYFVADFVSESTSSLLTLYSNFNCGHANSPSYVFLSLGILLLFFASAILTVIALEISTFKQF